MSDRPIVKVIVLGSSNVGKTALMKRYTTGKFSDVRRATVGADFMTKVMTLNDTEIIVQVWDTAGQEKFHQGTIGTPFYRGADGCLLVYDVTNEKSFEQLELWRDEVFRRIDKSSYFPLVVVGNKIDLRTPDSIIDQSSVIEWCRENAYGHIETSAKDDLGVEAAMQAVVALALEQRRSSVSVNDAAQGDRFVLDDKYTPVNKGKCC